MEKIWQICELEKYIGSFFEYSVKAVPGIWIKQLEDGSSVCYWPKQDAVQKIRSFAKPSDEENWETFKCRILMTGEKYSRYEEAKRAEKIAQDESCIFDNTKALNSTIDFDVTDVDVEEVHDEMDDDGTAFAPDCNSTMK